MSPRFRPPDEESPEDPGTEESSRPRDSAGGEMIDLPLGGSKRPGARVHDTRSGRSRRQERGDSGGRRRSDPPPESAGGTDLAVDEAADRATRIDESAAAAAVRPQPRRPTAPAPRKRAPSGGRRRWLLVVGLVLVAAVAGYFIPRPGAPVLGLSTALIDFGAPKIGDNVAAEPLTVTNDGQRELMLEEVRIDGESADDFVLKLENCSGRTLAALESCSIELAFRPSAPGDRKAELVLAGNAANSPVSLPLTGSGAAPRVGLDRERVAFDSQAVGGRSAAVAVTVTNSGSAALEIDRLVIEGPQAGDFERLSDACSGKRIDPGGGCALQVVFVPRATGERSAELLVASNASGSSARVLLSGEALAGALVAELSGGGLEFGERVVGTAGEALEVVLRNSGDESLSVGRLGIGESDAGFSLAADDCSGSVLDGGASCTVDVAFQPLREGEVETVLRAPFGDHGGGLEATVSGIGIATLLTLSPASLDFGSSALGAGAPAQAIKIVNTGGGPLDLTGAEVSGPNADSFAAVHDGCAEGRLEPGTECEIRVSFTPRASGRLEARVVVGARSEGAAGAVALAGVGVAAQLEVSSTSLDFGEVGWEASDRLRLTLRNAGNAPLTLRGMEIVGEAREDFRLYRTTCSTGGTLKPGLACGLSLTVRPTDEGLRTARLRIETSGGAGVVEVALRARVLPPPVPEVRVAPPALDFGNQGVGERSSIQTVTVESVGSGPLQIGEVRIEGAGGSFYLVPGSCQGIPRVAPGGRCTIGIRFYPRSAGEHRAQLVVPHNGQAGRTDVPLSGRAGGVN